MTPPPVCNDCLRQSAAKGGQTGGGVTAIILAGGKSSRMGRDKASLEFHGKTFLGNLLEIIAPLFQETLVIEKDILPEHGPLGGLYTGLFYSRHPEAMVFSCDMPLVDEQAIRLLWEAREEGEGICFEDATGRVHPFPGIYAKSTLSKIYFLLKNGDASMKDLFEVIKTQSVKLTEENAYTLTNVNTPDEYEQLVSPGS